MSGCRVRAIRTRSTIWPNCRSCPDGTDIARTNSDIFLSVRHKKASITMTKRHPDIGQCPIDVSGRVYSFSLKWHSTIFISLPQISRGVPSVFDRQCVEFYAFFYAAMYLNVLHVTTPRYFFSGIWNFKKTETRPQSAALLSRGKHLGT